VVVPELFGTTTTVLAGGGVLTQPASSEPTISRVEIYFIVAS
jgi:hypothetical protein